MIGTALQQDSRAGSRTERLLALFLGLALSIHGLYYPQEWFLVGFMLSGLIMMVYCFRPGRMGLQIPIGLTDCLLLGMVLASLLGMLKPVKLTDGILEALQWGIFWLFYRWGRSISFRGTAKGNFIRYIEWLAVAVAVIGWLPWVGKVGGRLSSVFGYPNATAAFLGAVLLLYPANIMVKILLGISLLGTGSRAGVGFFVLVLAGQYLLVSVNRTKGFRSQFLGSGLSLEKIWRRSHLKGLLGVVIGCTGGAILFFYSPAAWNNLTAWGFSSSSWQERFVYFRDGIKIAREAWGFPQAGGWQAFPTVQAYPYWTADPHSSIIHILLNQGIIGVIGMGLWSGYTLLKERRVWRGGGYSKICEETVVRLRYNSALLYLALHSLVDADFSFGSLGILFWSLYGSMNRDQRDQPHKSFYSHPQRLRLGLRYRGVLGLSAVICLMCGSVLLNPKCLEQEQVWNTQAAQWTSVKPDISAELWLRSLKWDQTQVKTRRDLAEHLLRNGHFDEGLKAVGDDLRWQAFDLEAYEWAQSVVLAAAEENWQKSPQKVLGLYRWVEEVPDMIAGRTANLSKFQQKLWPGYTDFLPSQHIRLLAEYARQRQLTQRLP